MPSESRFSGVERWRGGHAKVGVGCPSCGGQRAVGVYRAPSRGVVGFGQLSQLGHAKLSAIPRHAQPIAQADGFATA
jgi:hypothetical protein